MEVKRFFGTDAKEVLKQIRDTLGEEAMILSNRKLEDGVEILCTLDKETQENFEFDSAEFVELRDEDVVVTEDFSYIEMKRELNSLRVLIEDQLSDFAWKDIQINRPVYAVLIKRLMQAGFPASLAKSLASQIDEAADIERAWLDITQKLTRVIPNVSGDLLNTSHIMAFVGSSCSGKTSSLIKLAARYMLAQSTKDIVIITTDVYRVGSYESLKIYCNILGATLVVLEPTQSLSSVLEKVKSAKLILIDTPSSPKYRLQVLEEIKEVCLSGISITKLLVMSALQQYKVQNAFYQQVKRYDFSGCILTHLDEVSSLGEVFGLTMENQMPIAYVTNGEQVPEDIHIPDMTSLVKKCFELGARKDNDMIRESLAIKLLSEVV